MTPQTKTPTSSRSHGPTSETITKPTLSLNQVLEEIRRRSDPGNLSGMARYGIQTSSAVGVSVPQLRGIARKVGKNHELAIQLWETAIHEARILAAMIDEPSMVNEDQMDKWALNFKSWDVVDGTCGNLFDKTEFAVEKAIQWAKRPEEYVKRAGFVMMAELAVHDKIAPNKTFLEFLPLIAEGASDERNFVKKAVNWALRQIGKRNMALNKAALRTASTIQNLDSRSSKWVAADAIRELSSSPVQRRLKRFAVRPH